MPPKAEAQEKTITAFFIENATVEDEFRQPEKVFKEGETPDLPEASFDFWQARGKCISLAEAKEQGLVGKKPAPAAEGAPPAPSTEPVKDDAQQDPGAGDGSDGAKPAAGDGGRSKKGGIPLKP